MKYRIDARYCWYNKGQTMVLMYFINNIPFTFDDAPEDYYDNEDIVHFFIPLIKKYKDFRQIIFFTNNPILAVNSDPENYVLFRAEGKKLKNIISGFSIDKIDKKEEVIKLMEGSVKSFGKRRGRYGL